jgi:hypothetical protein
MTRHAAAVTVVTLCLSCLAVSTTLASDYSHTCRSADGRYEMNDGALFLSGSDASSGREIAYNSVKESILKQEIGYCETRSGKRYDFEFRSYTKRIAFKDQGQAFEFDMVCELAADGLPAAETCQKNVITSSSDDSGTTKATLKPPAPGTQGWTHNGSGMTLLATGNKRRFVYEKPRPGLSSVGIKRGDTVFEGTRSGSDYFGTAYIFKSGCSPQGYQVSGAVASDERSVAMVGKRPKVGNNCRVERYEDDTLVFELPDK